jgi:uncharacterized protein (DUF885 family)
MIKPEIMNPPAAYNRFMTRIPHALLLGVLNLGLAACGAAPAPPPSEAPRTLPPRDRLNLIAERFWDENASAGNPLSPQYVADTLAAKRRNLADLLAVPRAGLDADSRLTHDILRRRLELDIEGYTYPAELLPADPFDAMPLRLARAAADTVQFPLQTAQDLENWLRQVDGCARWTTQAIANMREGMRRGYTSPRSLMARMLPLLQVLGEDASANVFYLPAHNMAPALKPSERAQFAQSQTRAVKDKLLPAIRDLHDFIQHEYLPRARLSIALSVLPLGPSWYAFRVRRATGTEMSFNELHAIGLAEVERIRARMAAVPAVTGAPPGTPPAVNGYQLLKAETLAAMPMLFSATPPADFEIRESAPFGAAVAPLLYQPAAPERGKPAILRVFAAADAARPPGVDIAGFLEEALPGRHYQSALQQGRTDLPKFRRFGGEPALVDGWALYAATLGEELGLVRDDEARRGTLLRELNCAVALVVDTGVHAKSWTREQADDYLRAQLGVTAADADLAIDRFAARPGDALACKVGELRIQALRNRARAALGARFDVHEFHSQLLKDGAMPFDILEARMKVWMEARP